MPLNELFSLLSVIVMAIAFWKSSRHNKGNAVFLLQIIGYLLLAVSSWISGVNSAAFVLTMCAITLSLKMLRKYPPKVMLVFLLVTLAGGLALNNSGWVGLLPLAAGLGVIFRHTYKYSGNMALELFPHSTWENIEKYTWTILPQMDNAYRTRAHAVDVFLHNIVGVMLWGAYAWRIGDRYMLVWRSVVMLAINLYDYIRRIWPVVSDTLCGALSSPTATKRRRMPGKSNRKNKWII